MNRYAFLVVALLAAVGCTSQSHDDSQSKLPVKPVIFNATGSPTVQFSAPDMMCPEGCGAKIKEILSEQPGAKDVIVDFDGKTATVAIEEGKFDSSAAVAALVDHGFKNSSLKPAGEAAPAKPLQ